MTDDNIVDLDGTSWSVYREIDFDKVVQQIEEAERSAEQAAAKKIVNLDGTPWSNPNAGNGPTYPAPLLREVEELRTRIKAGEVKGLAMAVFGDDGHCRTYLWSGRCDVPLLHGVGELAHRIASSLDMPSVDESIQE